jgi:pimeloyl-ACP methyl ester carboxylesterase
MINRRNQQRSRRRGEIVVALSILAAAGCMPPSWGAGALLHPGRRIAVEPQRPHETRTFDGDGVHLKGWWFKAAGEKRGTVVYLHGVADSRGSSAGIADHFIPLGFDVVAYDGRAHGESDGEACTYGYYEKRDLSRVLDQLGATPRTIVIGTSLGAAVALQAAAEEPRISTVIAVATFSDLRTAASERAPFFASRGNIDDAFKIAEAQAHFQVDQVSPLRAAPRIRVPVLLVHGEADRETPAAHSQRVYAALPQPKLLFLVPGAGHNDALTAEAWRQIDLWIEGTGRGSSAVRDH